MEKTTSTTRECVNSYFIRVIGLGELVNSNDENDNKCVRLIDDHCQQRFNKDLLSGMTNFKILVTLLCYRVAKITQNHMILYLTLPRESAEKFSISDT